jgi:hypothetical protein
MNQARATTILFWTWIASFCRLGGERSRTTLRAAIPAHHRRYLEVATILELAEGINGGEIHVDGSLSHDDFWGRLPSEANDPAKMAAYVSERGWAPGAKGFTNQLREHLQSEADRLDLEVGLTRTVQLDRQRRPIVPRFAASEVPPSVAEAVRLVMDEMPERSVLEALANTAQWVDWTRHFGLPSRMSSGIANLRERYLITTVSSATFCPSAVSGRPLPEISAVVRPSWVTGHPPTAVLPNRHVENARS